MHNISIDSRERVNIIIEWILRSSVDKIKEEGVKLRKPSELFEKIRDFSRVFKKCIMELTLGSDFRTKMCSKKLFVILIACVTRPSSFQWF